MIHIPKGDEVARFLVDIGRKEYHGIGFIPITRLMDAQRRGNLYLEKENGELIGYAYLSPKKPVRQIHQIVVRDDARRLYFARRLLTRALGDSPAILRCAADIPGAEFWRACGFAEVRTEHPNTCRRRPIITFARGNTAPLLTATPSITRTD